MRGRGFLRTLCTLRVINGLLLRIRPSGLYRGVFESPQLAPERKIVMPRDNHTTAPNVNYLRPLSIHKARQVTAIIDHNLVINLW